VVGVRFLLVFFVGFYFDLKFFCIGWYRRADIKEFVKGILFKKLCCVLLI
jgi:hypothetical protein